MMDRTMNKLWRSFRTAVHELRISGWVQGKLHYYEGSDSARFRGVVARQRRTRAGVRQRLSGYRTGLATRYQLLKKAVVHHVESPSHSTSEGVARYGGEDFQVVADWGRWEQMKTVVECSTPSSTTDESEDTGACEQFIPIPQDRYGSLRKMHRSNTADSQIPSAGAVVGKLQQNSSMSASSAERWVDERPWDATFKCPFRGRMATTLSSLVKTLSYRQARRTGRLTAVCVRSSSRGSRIPLLSTTPVVIQQPRFSDATAASLARYDNPFQDFLRRSTSVQGRFSIDVARNQCRIQGLEFLNTVT